MALFEVGRDRFHKLFSVSSSLNRILIKDIRRKGLLTDAYVQGSVAKVYPVQPSKKAGKLCKIVLKEDEEGGKKPSGCAMINAFLYGDLAGEGYRIVEGDVLVLTEVIIEPSPTDGHQFQLIANRQISKVSLRVISILEGKRRIRECKEKKQFFARASENRKAVGNRETDLRSCTSDCGTDGMNNETIDEDAEIAVTTPKPLVLRKKRNRIEKRKFRLGPKGVSPSVSHVKGLTNLVVLIDKVSVRNLDKSLNRKKSYKLSTLGHKKRPSESNDAVYSTSQPRQLHAKREQSIGFKSGAKSLLHKQTTAVQKSTYKQKQSVVLRPRQVSPRGHNSQAQNMGRENSSSPLLSPRSFVAQQSSGESANSETKSIEARGCKSHRSPVMESSVQSTCPDEETRSPRRRQGLNSLDRGHKPQGSPAQMADDKTNTVTYGTTRHTSHILQWSPASHDSDEETRSPRRRQGLNSGLDRGHTPQGSPAQMADDKTNTVTYGTRRHTSSATQDSSDSRRRRRHTSHILQWSPASEDSDEETRSPRRRQGSYRGLNGGHRPQGSPAQMADDKTNIVTHRTRRHTSSATQDSSDSRQFTDFETLSGSPHQKRHMHLRPHTFHASSPTKPLHVSSRCNRSVDGVTNVEEAAHGKASLPYEMPESSLSVKDTRQVVTPEQMNKSAIELGDSLETPSGNFSPVSRKRSFSSQEEHIRESSDEDETSQLLNILLPVNYTKLDDVSSRNVSSSPSKEQSCSPAKRSCTERQITEETRHFDGVDSVGQVQDKQKPVQLLCTRSLIPHDHVTVAIPSSSSNNDSEIGVKQGDEEDSARTTVVRLTAASTHAPGPSHQQQSPKRNGEPRDGSRRTPSREVAVNYTVPSGYTKLANLQQDTVVNIFGIVKHFKPAWKCRGTDMCSVVFLTDPTVSEASAAEGLECVLFQENTLRLPQVHNVGDITRLHRVKIASYQKRLQGKSSRGFAAIVFDRNAELPVTERMARVSSTTFTLTQTDKDTVHKLRNWCDANPDLFPSLIYSTVASIIPDSNFHLVCQVRAVAMHQTMDCVVLFVSDGTQPQYEVRKCSSDEYHMIVPVSSEPTLNDSTVCVFLYGLHAQAAKVQVQRSGMFVILHDVHPQVLRGGIGGSDLDTTETLLELCVHRNSMFGRGITVLPPDSEKAAPIMERVSGTPCQ